MSLLGRGIGGGIRKAGLRFRHRSTPGGLGGTLTTASLAKRGSLPPHAGRRSDSIGTQIVSEAMTRVLLADDQALVRSGFRMLIEAEDDLTVVGEVSDGAAAVHAVREQAPDVVLMDIRMPVMDGVEATRRIVASGVETKVLVLTTFDVDEYVFAALRAGASGFLLKDARPGELLAAIRSVAGGDAILAPSATRMLLDHVAQDLPTSQSAPDERLGLLTEREIDVLKEVARGLTNAEIAESLFMAEGTVKTHIGRLLSKLQVRDRVGLVLFAFETGLVER